MLLYVVNCILRHGSMGLRAIIITVYVKAEISYYSILSYRCDTLNKIQNKYF